MYTYRFANNSNQKRDQSNVNLAKWEERERERERERELISRNCSGLYDSHPIVCSSLASDTWAPNFSFNYKQYTICLSVTKLVTWHCQRVEINRHSLGDPIVKCNSTYLVSVVCVCVCVCVMVPVGPLNIRLQHSPAHTPITSIGGFSEPIAAMVTSIIPCPQTNNRIQF